MKPTLQIYGTGKRYGQDGRHLSNQALLARISPDFAFKWRSENAFSPVFSFTGEAYAADAMICFPDCDLFSLFSAMAESEVDNPFMQHQYDPTRTLTNNKKPVICLGTEEDWKPLRDLIDGLNRHGTIRGNLLEKTVHFSTTIDDAIAHIKARIPPDAADKRARQDNHKQFIDHPDAAEDIIRRDADAPKPKKFAPTIAFFGSATTKNEENLALARAAGKACGEQGWNIIHGGGVKGVMGALSDGGSEFGVYVHGISASNRWAMYLSGEKDPTKIVPDGQGRYTLGKDMVHRIELYAYNSEAMVALPGGIGTLQEIALMMELLEEKHPAVMYEDTHGNNVKKPMILVNADGVWDGLIAYCHNPKRPELQKLFDENVTIVGSIEEMNTALQRQFAQHPPKEFAIDHVDDTIKTLKREAFSRHHQQMPLFPEGSQDHNR